MTERMQLSDDKKTALQEIAGYLRAVNMSNARAVWDNEESKEIIGHYQLTDYLVGLLEIADECDRLANNEIVNPAPPQEPVAWRIRIGDSNLWSYCDNESDADFYGKQSGRPYAKQPLSLHNQQPTTPPGWQLVPNIPTLKMTEAAYHGMINTDCVEVYQAMLSAAPTYKAEQ